MSKQKAGVRATIKKTRHATQPWTVTIDLPGNGPNESFRARYTERKSAVRGVARKLGAVRGDKGGYGCIVKGRPYTIEFIFV